MPKKLANAGQRSASVLDCDRIIIPLNQGQMHWTCAVVDLKERKLSYYDSLMVGGGPACVGGSTSLCGPYVHSMHNFVDPLLMQGEDSLCLESLAKYVRDEYKNKKGEEVRPGAWSWYRFYFVLHTHAKKVGIHARLLACLQRDDVLKWPRVYPKDIPKQLNGCDCGVFSLMFADYAVGDPRALVREKLLRVGRYVVLEVSDYAVLVCRDGTPL
jgi:Ulp1 family protease